MGDRVIMGVQKEGEGAFFTLEFGNISLNNIILVFNNKCYETIKITLKT